MLAESHILDQLAANATSEKHLYFGVSWDTYLQAREVIGDDSNVRLTFSHGVLEIMSPKRPHEQITRLVDMVVSHLAFDLGMNVDNCGSMTLRFESAQRGGNLIVVFISLTNQRCAVLRRLIYNFTHPLTSFLR